MDLNNSSKKILLVEDDPILGEAILNTLVAEGFDASWARNGAEGLAKMHEIVPSLVLLDIEMPEKNGYEVLEEMRREDALKLVPVMVISNSGQPIELERIRTLGVKEYLIKAQFSPKEVLEKMQTLLAQTPKTISASPSPATSSAEENLGGNILIVEDDPFLSSVISARLSSAGYTISTAMNGPEALKLLETLVPDIMMLDIIMPEMSGIEVLKQVKANTRLNDVTVIMFSNLSQDRDIQEAKKLGANGFIVKANATPKEVANRIAELLKQRRSGHGTGQFIQI